MLEVMVVERSGIDICHDGGYRRAATSRASGPLLVVFTHRRNVTECHRCEGADIDADLHCRRAGKDVHGILVVERVDVLEPHLIFLGGGPAFVLSILMRQLSCMLLGIDPRAQGIIITLKNPHYRISPEGDGTEIRKLPHIALPAMRAFPPQIIRGVLATPVAGFPPRIWFDSQRDATRIQVLVPDIFC